jgi:IclR family acetate operon transcriptional repressor
MMSQANSGGVKVLTKAFALLEAVGESESGRSLTELAGELEMPVGTVHRLLRHLVMLGYLEQAPDSKLYHLGLKVLTLRAGAIAALHLAFLARPHLRELMLTTGCVAHLAAYRSGEVVYLDRVDTPDTVGRLTPSVGRRYAAHRTALGKVLLAALPDGELDEFLATTSLARFTPNTITDPTLLKEHLITVRMRGYALDREEGTPGLWCVAAPVRDYTGRTVAATSVSMHSRPGPARLQELIRIVGERAGRISAAAGYPMAAADAIMELPVRPESKL